MNISCHVIGILVSVMVAIIAPSGQAATKNSQEVLQCHPDPKPLYYQLLTDNRESRYPHHGQVRLSFTIDLTGRVRDVRIEKSTDSWFNERSVESVLLWRYPPPTRECRENTVLKFETKD